MPKTPFEIRLDLLTMATNILTQHACAKNEEILENAKLAQNMHKTVTLRSMPTTDEIVIEAQKLNTFVSK